MCSPSPISPQCPVPPLTRHLAFGPQAAWPLTQTAPRHLAFPWRGAVKEAYALGPFQGLGDALYFGKMSTHSRIISLEPADGHGDGRCPPTTDNVWTWRETAPNVPPAPTEIRPVGLGLLAAPSPHVARAVFTVHTFLVEASPAPFGNMY